MQWYLISRIISQSRCKRTAPPGNFNDHVVDAKTIVTSINLAPRRLETNLVSLKLLPELLLKCKWQNDRTFNNKTSDVSQPFCFQGSSLIDIPNHYNDVTMTATASLITSLTIVCSTVYSSADQRKHQSSASLAFVRGIHGRPVNSPHKWPVTRKMSPFDDVIMY